MKNNLSFLVGAVVLIIFIAVSAFAISKVIQRQTQEAIEPLPQPSPVENFPATSPSPQTLGQANTPAIQPESGSNTLAENNIRIFIENPFPSTLVTSPLIVNGFTNLTSGVIVARVTDERGQILGQSLSDTCTVSESCSFQINVPFVKSQSRAGTVEVYNVQPSSPRQLLQAIIIRFQ